MESIWNNLPSFLYHLFDPDSPSPNSHICTTPTIATTATPTASPTATTPTTATPTASLKATTPTTASTPNTYSDIRDIRDIMIR